MKCLNQWKCWLVSCKMITTMLAFFVLLFSSWKCWLVSCKMITTSYCYCTGNIYWWKCWLVSCKMITTIIYTIHLIINQICSKYLFILHFYCVNKMLNYYNLTLPFSCVLYKKTSSISSER